ncbi:hypothetical protein VPH35_028875 [Triticum aestivum]
MCEYTGAKNDTLRHSPDDLPAHVVDDMTKSLLNESLADCGKVGLAPFCKDNPAPKAGDKFWKVKYDHEAAKKARKEKRAARKEAAQRKGKKATASDLLWLSYSSESEVALDSLGLFFNHLIDTDHQQEDTGTSCSKADEDTSPPSGESLQSNLPTFKTAPGGQAKPSKRVRKNKPADERVTTDEPALETIMPELNTHELPHEPAQDVPPPTDLPTDQGASRSENPQPPSPTRMADPSNTDVEITGTGHTDPGMPTVLAKCPAKEELLDQRRVKTGVTNYTHMSIGDIFSGYMSQVHNSRNLEIDMVKQMHHKFEL